MRVCIQAIALLLAICTLLSAAQPDAQPNAGDNSSTTPEETACSQGQYFIPHYQQCGPCTNHKYCCPDDQRLDFTIDQRLDFCSSIVQGNSECAYVESTFPN